MEQQDLHCELSKYKKVQGNGTSEFWAGKLIFFVMQWYNRVLCVCITVCVYYCVCMCITVCVCVASVFLCHSQGTWHLCQAEKAREQCLRTCVSVTGTLRHTPLSMDTRSSNPDLYVCKESTIIHLDLSPSPQWLFLKYLSKLCKKNNKLKDGLSESRQHEEKRTLHRLPKTCYLRDWTSNHLELFNQNNLIFYLRLNLLLHRGMQWDRKWAVDLHVHRRPRL